MWERTQVHACGGEASLDSPTCVLPSFYIPVAGVKWPQFGEAAVLFFSTDASGMQGSAEQEAASLRWGSTPGC